MIVAIGPAQQVELDEAGQLIEIGIPAEPAALELLLMAFDDFKTVRCDVHLVFSCAAPVERSCHRSANLIVSPALTVIPGFGSILRN